MSVTEQQLGELELLSQSQLKLNQLTGRITAILSSFDGRLRGLESSIVPLHRSTQRLLRAEVNIDRTLAALERTETQQASIADLEPIIRTGPSADNVPAYLEVLDEIKITYSYVESTGNNASGRRIQELMAVGADRLSNLLKSWVEAESEPIDPREHLQRGMQIPAFSDVLLKAIIPILNYLAGMRSGGYYLTGALNAYISARSAFVVSSLSMVHTEVLDFVETRASGSVAREDGEENTYIRGMGGFQSLVESTYELCSFELQKAANLLSSMNPLPPPEVSQTTINIASPPLSQLVSTASNVSSTLTRANASKKPQRSLGSLSFHVGLVLDFVSTLAHSLPTFEKAFTGHMTADARARKTEGSIRELRGVEKTQRQLCAGCLRQVIDGISTVSAKYDETEGTASTTVHDISYDSLRLLLQVYEFRSISGPVLRELGSGNLMPGTNAPPMLNVALNGVEEEQANHNVLVNYLNNIVATLLSALEQRSKSIRQPSTSAIFLLNNVGFLQRELAAAPVSQNNNVSMLEVLGQDCDDMLSGTLRSAHTAYLDAWGPCVQALMEDVPLAGGTQSSGAKSKLATSLGGGNDKAIVKDRLARFYECLDDMEQLHRAFPFSKEDLEVRTKLLREVSRMICPLYNKFIVKHRQSGFSRDPSKHIRMTEKEIALKLDDIFR
ncbi:hypothetical protein K437DRAFT_267572 [Tilletiaria anomala UBC 951]|uniref:Exocyst complex protein EXO70 n=1 Tax=Tilletiaria anomala (strain ATCC 24038 / CBS 436.72 / UBC 951) TaxID=1037660 RepID=A0A066W3G7_TILAU|nr:uncharacterized protein K437DRAFT_267572 [Tilletiaria anomala UBC 951]KDN48502.1 hypothetical protein K437DRAFT_267572 [Tilletiaria anomala UBC 951]